MHRVGVGKRDITGPAGDVGMMGYGDAGQTTTGILNRLYARAYIIEEVGQSSSEDQHNHRALIVHCDLHAIYQLVHQEVVQRLKLKYSGLYTEQNIVLHATHTHGGPGGASAYFLYGVSIWGFVGENFDVIVDGIMDAIEQARMSIRPSSIRFNKGTIANSGVNRSPEAYDANPEQERRMYTSNHDTELTMLQFRDGDDKLIGLLAFYPVHPTSATSIVSGRYRIRHRGFYKSITGETRPYEGLSSVFQVALDTRVCVADGCELTGAVGNAYAC